MRGKRLTVLGAALISVAAGGLLAAAPQARPRVLDAPYIPTPQPVVDAMLKMAKVTGKDIVFDLGCGDGRIVITAAQKYGASGVGVDLDPERIRESRANAEKAKVADRVKFIEGDLFKTDLKPATVVTLFLLPDVNLRLRPKLWRELRPGTRIVSHAFDMGDWEPRQKQKVAGKYIYYWEIPGTVPAPARTETGKPEPAGP